MDRRDRDEMTYRREQYVNRLMRDNADAGAENGLTEEQANLLEQICYDRHKLHTLDASRVYMQEGDKITGGFNADMPDNFYDDCEALGLPQLPQSISCMVNEMYDYTDFIWYEVMDDDDKAEYRREGDDEDDDSDAKERYYEDCLYKISDLLSRINDEIESYLHDVDEKYGTHYEPTGAQRIW